MVRIELFRFGPHYAPISNTQNCYLFTYQYVFKLCISRIYLSMDDFRTTLSNYIITIRLTIQNYLWRSYFFPTKHFTIHSAVRILRLKYRCCRHSYVSRCNGCRIFYRCAGTRFDWQLWRQRSSYPTALQKSTLDTYPHNNTLFVPLLDQYFEWEK